MDSASIRNFKDFLQLYNQISEGCFSNCINNFNNRDLQKDELSCVDLCSNKHVKTNHKILAVYMEVQPIIVNRRVQEMNEANEKLAAVAAAAAAADVAQLPVDAPVQVEQPKSLNIEN